MRIPAKVTILALSIALGWAGWTGLNALVRATPAGRDGQENQGATSVTKKIQKSDKDWKSELSPEQYRVMRQCGTEPPWSGKYNDFFAAGTYVCAACGTPLFESGTKYDHGTGWPSFTAPIDPANVEYRDDHTLGMRRVEVRCAVCGAHLGHVFDDGPAPTGRHYCINSAAMNFVPAAAGNGPAESERSNRATSSGAAPKKTDVAMFAAGCFWGVEYKFGQVKGVLATTVGYSGGLTKDPTYEDVCTDRTGHAESVMVTFDPSVIGYYDLVRKFFTFHDPTELNRQGPDIGTQYRSVIFYYDDAQKRMAERVKSELQASKAFKKPVVTKIVPAGEFFKAEDYHQKYYEKNKIKSCGF